MTDQEKIEAAAEEYSFSKTFQCINDTFIAGVAWRDRNPGPHVITLVETLDQVRDDISELGGHYKFIDEVLAKFEKIMKEK